MSKHNPKRRGHTLAGRLALITGANRGIGLAIARALACKGCDLIITGRDERALAKARAAANAQPNTSDRLFIAADTVVVVAGEILGKPESPEDARRMLHLLSGAVHEVHTGLAVIRRPGAMEGIVEEITRVTFARLSDEEIESYMATGEPFDKAGAYGIQGIGGRYVTRIEGCYFNVMGLPLARLWSLLREFGWKKSAPA